MIVSSRVHANGAWNNEQARHAASPQAMALPGELNTLRRAIGTAQEGYRMTLSHVMFAHVPQQPAT
jgi:hypothetical protein